MIQAIVTRKGGNSFEVRKCSVGIITAVLGFTVDKAEWKLGVLALVAALVFWYLNSFYLYQPAPLSHPLRLGPAGSCLPTRSAALFP